MFNEQYFYLITFNTECSPDTPLYFRVSKIKHITKYRKKFTYLDAPEFNEGLLSQGRRIKVISPPDFVEEIKIELEQMMAQYENETSFISNLQGD